MKKIRKTTFFILSFLILISCQNNSRKIENIKTFTKLYGYVRWFHPSDEAQQIDWDKFAILGVQRVENANSSAELRETLLELFSPIVQGLKITNKRQKDIDLSGLIPKDTTNTKFVSWQHFGVELKGADFGFSSIRTNVGNYTYEGFYLKRISNIGQYIGKEIKFSAYFNLEQGLNVDAKIFLLPIKKGRTKSRLRNLNKNNSKISSSKWKKVEITRKVTKDVDYFLIGFSINNVAPMFVDNLELSVKNNGKWEEIEIFNRGFELKLDSNESYWEESIPKMFRTQENVFSGKFSLKCEPKDKQFEKTVKFGEFINEDIGSSLYCNIPLSLYKKDTSTYPVSDKKIVEDLKTKISKINIKNYDKKIVNIASLTITWNILQHFFPYFDVLNINWDSVFSTTLEEVYLAKKPFTRIIKEMLAKLDDCHIAVLNADQMYYLPFKVDLVEGKIIVTASNNKTVKVADIIKIVDGVDSKDLLTEIENTISGSPQFKTFCALNIFGAKYVKKRVKLKVERNNNELYCDTYNSKTICWKYKEYINKSIYRLDTLKEIGENIYYLNLSKCTKDYFLDNIDILSNAKCVIYDYRWGKKFNFLEIVEHFFSKPLVSRYTSAPETIYPNQVNAQYKENSSIRKLNSPKFKSKSIVITSPRIISHLETSIDFINEYKLATTVGEYTGGCNGSVNYIYLPNGYQIRWSAMRSLKYDGRRLHGIGYQPDYPVKRTLKGVKEGRDEVLQKALELANE